MNKLQEAILKKLNEAGAMYEGMKNQNNQYHGKGKLTYLDGTYYDGEWSNGQRNGHGTHVFIDGTTFIGTYVNDKKHGVGEMKLLNG